MNIARTYMLTCIYKCACIYFGTCQNLGSTNTKQSIFSVGNQRIFTIDMFDPQPMKDVTQVWVCQCWYHGGPCRPDWNGTPSPLSSRLSSLTASDGVVKCQWKSCLYRANMLGYWIPMDSRNQKTVRYHNLGTIKLLWMFKWQIGKVVRVQMRHTWCILDQNDRLQQRVHQSLSRKGLEEVLGLCVKKSGYNPMFPWAQKDRMYRIFK